MKTHTPKSNKSTQQKEKTKGASLAPPSIHSKSNKVGMPYNLKSGIENSSSIGVPAQLAQRVESSNNMDVGQRVIRLEAQPEETIRKKLGEEIRKSNGIIKKGTQYGVEINQAEGLLARVEWEQEQRNRAIALIRSLRTYVEGKVKPTVAVHMKK